MTGLDALVLGRRNWLRLPELRLGGGGVVDFLHEQVASGDVLLHGSNSRTIERFEPREQTSYHGVPVGAVFATPDPVWPLFFAVTDTGRAGSRWNMCLLPERSGAARPRYSSRSGRTERRLVRGRRLPPAPGGVHCERRAQRMGG